MFDHRRFAVFVGRHLGTSLGDGAGGRPLQRHRGSGLGSKLTWTFCEKQRNNFVFSKSFFALCLHNPSTTSSLATDVDGLRGFLADIRLCSSLVLAFGHRGGM